MYCKKCGSQINDKAKFCPKCGTQFTKRIADMKKKKRHRITALLTSFVLLIGACGGVFVFKDEIFDLFSSEKQFDENNVGEIYFQEIDEEHVAETENGTMYADNEILVVAVDGTSYSKVEKLAEDYDAEIVGWIEQAGDHQWLLSDTYTLDELEDLAEELEHEKIIDSASVNGIFEMSEDTVESRDGFYYGEEWQSDLQDFNDYEGKSWGIEAIETLGAWDLLASNDDTNPVRVGLFDFSFDVNHNDLGFVETFYNGGFDANDTSTTNSHGTHVAGTMAVKTVDNTGICGVYPYGGGNLYWVSSSGVYNYSENKLSDIAYKCAFAELIFRNVQIINVSLGFGYYKAFADYDKVLNYLNNHDFSEEEAQAAELAEFFNRLLIKGYDFVIVNSAGNDSDSSIGHLESRYNSPLSMIDEKTYPDVYDRIIVVGSVNADFEISSFSNTGERVDVFAPGESIYSTVINSRYQGGWEGTSMAAPHVSGVAACVWAANNDLTGAEVKKIICSSKSLRCTSCNMIDAYFAISKALGIETEGTEETDATVENGGILGWVVNVEDEDTKIEGAEVTVTNVDTGEAESTVTDSAGHFELILPEGQYTLTVTAEGYVDYIWQDGNDFQNPIEVKNEGVNYLDGWIKMTPEVTTPDIVQVVLDNEELWLESLNDEYHDENSVEFYDNYCLFQDMDIDGNVEFIVGGDVTGIHAHSFHVYKYINNELIECLEYTDSHSTLCFWDYINHEPTYDGFLCKLYKNNDTGEFIYVSPGEDGIASESYYILDELEFLSNNTFKWNTIVEYVITYTSDPATESFYSGDYPDQVNISLSEFLNIYDAHFANMTPYRTTMQAIPCSEISSDRDGYYDSMSDEEKLVVLTESYNAWSYTEDNSIKRPLADVIDELRDKVEAMPTSGWKDAYAEFLLNKEYEQYGTWSDMSSPQFMTIYIDDDNIPELVISYSSAHATGVLIVTYVDGKATPLEGIGYNGGAYYGWGSYGGIYYTEKAKGKFMEFKLLWDGKLWRCNLYFK
ncbi:MAG: S8 family serine peptidase [Ruminococcus sp.]|nr:S8 family serine peptidase [Ruminococcus sp.]